jgi:hypothetical protein
MPRVFNKHHKDEAAWQAVYVGRPSKWGNPFEIGKDGTREEVISKYAGWIQTQPDLLDQLPELKGRDLVCWCFPASCHADVLLALANQEI